MAERTVEVIRVEPKGRQKERKEKIRAAAYCRVSTLMEEQELSFESQCEYYKELIEGTPDMVLAGIYGDQGCSGLHAESRPELQRLLQDCREGKIDLILVKSISRFARNVIECIAMVEELKSLGTVVEFGREGIRSDDANFELMLKLLASAAQEESNSLSQSVSWAYDKNAELGQPTRACCYGYRKAPRKKGGPHIWEIYEPEAERVRKVFYMASKGIRYAEIARRMNEWEKENGEITIWKVGRIQRMLANEAYKGDILTNKNYTPDYLSGKIKRNKGEHQQFYIEGHHEPIIPPEQFDEIRQMIRARRPA